MSSPAKVREQYQRALAGASMLHILVGTGRLVSGEMIDLFRTMCRLDQLPGLNSEDAVLRQLRQQEEDMRSDAEKRYYAGFLIAYGLILGAYSAFTTWKVQRWALAIETFRVSCYVFMTSLEEFSRPFDANDVDDIDLNLPSSRQLFARQLWKLIGIMGLLGHICGLND